MPPANEDLGLFRPSLWVLIGAAWVASVALPVATYGGTLAWFGPAHVAAELSWVRARFSEPLGWRWWAMAPVLGTVGVGRAAAFFGLLSYPAQHVSELACGVVLVLLASPLLRGRSRLVQLAGAATAAALGLGIALEEDRLKATRIG